MKKTIVAVMVAASAVLSAQAMATNTAQVTVLGEVSDAANSCVVRLCTGQRYTGYWRNCKRFRYYFQR